ncbi:MAG TPA: hypothetical protein VMB50_14640 [Myxococcales bacterium]|nr:hypothetical protein [Myxococcales bacterium]
MSKRNVTVELVEQFEVNEAELSRAVRDPDPPRLVRESEVNRLVQEGREARDAREVERDMRLGLRTMSCPARVAEDMKRRSDFLRSRPLMPRTARRELAMLGELDALEAQARALSVAQALGGAVDVMEVELLSLAAFAARGRFHDLLDAQGDRFPSRARPEDPALRKRELQEIEAFMRRKRKEE